VNDPERTGQSVTKQKELQMSNSIKHMRAVRGISQSLCVVFVVFTCGVLSAQNQAHRIRNIVLVHGAWADGSGWKGVYDILVKDGYNVSIVQEPETSFQDDVTAVNVSSHCKTGRASLSRTAMGEP
jgi:hypothetical protein